MRETEFQFANRSYDQTIKICMSFERDTVDLLFNERYRYRYQTLALFFKAFELFFHRSEINFGRQF